MSLQARTRLFLVAGFGFLALFIYGLRGLPISRQSLDAYAQSLNELSVPERHITDVVTAVNFDFRAFDTLGEEYILFTSVMGVILLLRRQSDEALRKPSEQASDRNVPPSSDAVRVCVLALFAPTVLFGSYVISHGQVSPGGGFQGGIILATAFLFTFLAGNYETFERIHSHLVVEVLEALGASGFILVGLAGVVAGHQFLNNAFPLGQAGTIGAGGTVLWISLSVGTEVSAGILLLATAFLEETLVLQTRGGK